MDIVLYIFLGLLILAAFVSKIWLARHPEIFENLRANLTPTGKPERQAWPYRARPSLLTPNEHAFFQALHPLIQPHWHLFAKIRMEDILEVRKGLERKAAYGYRSRIKSRHLDFAICDKDTLQVLMCIELDDRSHNSSKARETDAFKDQAMKDAGLTLTRIPAQSQYDPEKLKPLIFEEPETAPTPVQSKRESDPHARWKPPSARSD